MRLPAPERAIDALLVAVPLAVVLGLYGQSLHYPFHFDDRLFFHDETLEYYRTAAFGFDLRWVAYKTFGWTYGLVGNSVGWFRAQNIALHGLVAAALFVFFARLFTVVLEPQQTGAGPRTLACAGATIFACHPVAVYAVAYVIERSIIMATLFGVLMLAFYCEGVLRRSVVWLLGSALLYALAVFSKEHAIMLPVVAIAITPLLRRSPVALIRQLWPPCLLFLAIALAIVLRSKGILGQVYEALLLDDMTRAEQVLPGAWGTHPYALSFLNQSFLFFRYLLVWLVPYPGWMSVDLRVPLGTSLFEWSNILGVLGFTGYGLVASRLILCGGTRSLAGLGMLYPWLLFATEFSAVRFQEPFVLYRSYLWMSGLPLMLPLLAGKWPGRWATALLVGWCLALLPLTLDRLHSFSSQIALWTDAIEKLPEEKAFNFARPYAVRARAYYDLGDVERAASDYSRAIELSPGRARYYAGRGRVFYKSGRPEQAIRDFSKAIELDPTEGSHYSGRALAYAGMGRQADAMREFERAIEVDPANPDAYAARCVIHMRLSAWREAIADCDKALAIRPRHQVVQRNRKIIDQRVERLRSQLALTESQLRSDPGDAGVYLRRGNIELLLQEAVAARESFKKSCELGEPLGCEALHTVPRSMTHDRVDHRNTLIRENKSAK